MVGFEVGVEVAQVGIEAAGGWTGGTEAVVGLGTDLVEAAVQIGAVETDLAGVGVGVHPGGTLGVESRVGDLVVASEVCYLVFLGEVLVQELEALGRGCQHPRSSMTETLCRNRPTDLGWPRQSHQPG